jgi:hypothetical protein
MIVNIKRTLPILLLASLASIALIIGAIGANYGVLEASKDLGNLPNDKNFLNKYGLSLSTTPVTGAATSENLPPQK